MKSLKVILTAAALSVLASNTVALAQQKGKQSPEQQIERIEQAVGSLSAEQKEKLKAIYAKTADAMKGIPKEERKEKGAALQKKQREEINAVLTAEQRQKWQAAQKKK